MQRAVEGKRSLVLLRRKRAAKALFLLFIWRQIKDLYSSFPGHLGANTRKNRRKNRNRRESVFSSIY
jgi:hypothetical protein